MGRTKKAKAVEAEAAPAARDEAPRKVEAAEAMVLPVADLEVWAGNVRAATVTAADVAELAESIRRHGLAEPVLVNRRTVGPKGRTWILFAGVRRLTAVRALGLPTIRAMVYDDLSDEVMDDLSAIENLHREDVNPIEEARGYARMLATRTLEEVASTVERSPDVIRRRVELLRLVPEVQAAVASGRIPLGHAQVVARAGDKAGQMRLAERTMGVYWSTPWKKALTTDHVCPLKELYLELQTMLRNLGGKWPLEERFAGQPPCAGCADNTATEPGLFARVAVIGSSGKGNCVNPTCYGKKMKALEKEREKRRVEREKARAEAEKRAAKKGAKEEAAAEPAAKGKKKKAEKEAPFPVTAEDFYAIELARYGTALGARLAEALAEDRRPETVNALMLAAAVELNDLFPDFKGQAALKKTWRKLLAAEPVAFPEMWWSAAVPAVCDPLEEPESAHSVPLPKWQMEHLEVMEALAGRLGIEGLPVRPVMGAAKVEPATTEGGGA